ECSKTFSVQSQCLNLMTLRQGVSFFFKKAACYNISYTLGKGDKNAKNFVFMPWQHLPVANGRIHHEAAPG
ncbi:hypothetical protein LUB13_09165, partial [Lactobacillus delbrueckii subsp. lactis]|uniref:hypothetical protein n=1 Tax=Lactobacillus delbrueckii TaxID=1584 RepID=UPI001E42E120